MENKNKSNTLENKVETSLLKEKNLVNLAVHLMELIKRYIMNMNW